MIGRMLGPYQVLSKLGEGGMGEVYRARDVRLGRDVALKILPDAFARDPDRLARFRREAHVLASLNHPAIAHLYGIEARAAADQEDGAIALVLELVDGLTLADRIARGPVPVEEALRIATQIAEALEAAHEHGIIHRDLKPANVKVREDGTVKVLDFGLAKATIPDFPDGASAGQAVSQSPTITTPAMTETGMILGTAAYMSPEQARGKPVDKRADIWAFGCVVFEMLTGRRTFDGEDVSMTLSMVLQREPDWTALPSDLPPAVPVFLKRCLQKDPRQRVRDAGDLRLALEGAFDSLEGAAGPSRPASSRVLLTALGGLLLGSLVTGVAFWSTRAGSEATGGPVSRFSVVLAPDRSFSQVTVQPLAVTPDGRRIVFSGGAGAPGIASNQLYSRSLEHFDAVAIPGGGAPVGSVFLSPDGEWIGFVGGTALGNALRRIRVVGGPVATVVPDEITLWGGGSWGTNGTIVYAGGAGGLMAVSDGGGVPEQVTSPPAGESHLHPFFLPDGRLLFTRRSEGQADEVAVLDLRTRAEADLVAGSWPRYASTGHLVFAREGAIWAVPLDLGAMTLGGDPLPVVEDVLDGGLFSFSNEGTLVYSARDPAAGLVLTWVDRQGTPSSLPQGPDDYWLPRLSPDGRRLAVGIGADLWVIDLDRGARTRVTFGETSRQFPYAWFPDGSQIAFASPDSNRIYRVSSDGSGGPEVLLAGDHPQWPTGWSPDGRALAFYVNNPETGRDLWTLPGEPGGSPRLFLGTRFQERAPRFSPDGRWVAYVSDESGRDEVYVRPYPGPGGQVSISVGGGTEPVWAHTGRELFYRTPGALMVVDVTASSAFSAGTPRRLLTTNAFTLELGGVGGNPSYDVDPDGQRFLMLAGTPIPTEVRVVINWFEELKHLVPVD